VVVSILETIKILRSLFSPVHSMLGLQILRRPYLDLTLQIQVADKPLTSMLTVQSRMNLTPHDIISKHVVERHCGRRSRSKNRYDKRCYY
jgi:hypothetical protein